MDIKKKDEIKKKKNPKKKNKINCFLIFFVFAFDSSQYKNDKRS